MNLQRLFNPPLPDEEDFFTYGGYLKRKDGGDITWTHGTTEKHGAEGVLIQHVLSSSWYGGSTVLLQLAVLVQPVVSGAALLLAALLCLNLGQARDGQADIRQHCIHRIHLRNGLYHLLLPRCCLPASAD